MLGAAAVQLCWVELGAASSHVQAV